MANISSQTVKKWAKDLGADVVGVASVDRFDGAPPGHNPIDLMPEARSVIVAGVRIPDPVVDYDKYHLKFKGEPQDVAVAAHVENFYHLMGHYTIDSMLNTMAVRIANKLEIEYGYKSLPTPNTSRTGLGHPVQGLPYALFSQRHAATRAGLGEFGFNNIVLTPEFGPRVRFVSTITETDLEPDPLLTERICLREKCGGHGGPICLQKCTAGAIRLSDEIDHNSVFIDTPSKTDRSLCGKRMGESSVHHYCVFMGTCMRVCPIKLNLKKIKEANQ